MIQIRNTLRKKLGIWLEFLLILTMVQNFETAQCKARESGLKLHAPP